MWDSIPGPQDQAWAEGGAKPLSPRAAQSYDFYFSFYIILIDFFGGGGFLVAESFWFCLPLFFMNTCTLFRIQVGPFFPPELFKDVPLS